MMSMNPGPTATTAVFNPTVVTPPASVPLGFLASAGVGMLGFGFATWFAADRIIATPSHPGAVSAAHTAVLAFLTVAVLGAVHQFAPVAGRRPLRSVPAARFTLGGMVATAWLLPTGFAHGPDWLIPAAGLLGAVTVTVAAWNLSGPLLGRGGCVPIAGLRLSILYLLVTVAFGVVYAFNRETGWFPLYPSRVMAHAHLGLLGWLGLTYVSVAEKLWPMFLLSHRPSNRSGFIAVAGVGAGVAPLAAGLLFSIPALAWAGGGLVVVGLAAHAVSLMSSIRHRRRSIELLHGFLIAAMMFLTVGVVTGILAAVLPVDTTVRVRLVSGEVAALIAWIGLAVAGHVHKIVPFIVYTTLRSAGISRHPESRPLLFTDLYHQTPARLTLVSAVIGFGMLVAGILTDSTSAVAVAGVVVAATAVVATLNLALTPRFVAQAPNSPHGPKRTTPDSMNAHQAKGHP
jgi:hypothetical protein